MKKLNPIGVMWLVTCLLVMCLINYLLKKPTDYTFAQLVGIALCGVVVIWYSAIKAAGTMFK